MLKVGPGPRSGAAHSLRIRVVSATAADEAVFVSSVEDSEEAGGGGGDGDRAELVIGAAACSATAWDLGVQLRHIVVNPTKSEGGWEVEYQALAPPPPHSEQSLRSIGGLRWEVQSARGEALAKGLQKFDHEEPKFEVCAQAQGGGGRRGAVRGGRGMTLEHYPV